MSTSEIQTGTHPNVTGAIQLTEEKFLNLYTLSCHDRNGNPLSYTVASRARTPESLAAISGNARTDAVVIYATHQDETTGEKRLVLVNQYRYPLARRIYELPAGLIENGEPAVSAAIREMLEETGLSISIPRSFIKERPAFSSPGMTDEGIITLFGKCSGTPTNAHQEATEDIQVVLADIDECLRILEDGDCDVRTFWAMKHFIAQEEMEMLKRELDALKKVAF